MTMNIYTFCEYALRNGIASREELCKNHAINEQFGHLLTQSITPNHLKHLFSATNLDINTLTSSTSSNIEDLVQECKTHLIYKTDTLLATHIKFTIGKDINELVKTLNENGIESKKDLKANPFVLRSTYLHLASLVSTVLINYGLDKTKMTSTVNNITLIIIETLASALEKYNKDGESALPPYGEEYNEHAYISYTNDMLISHMRDIYKKVSVSKPQPYTQTDIYGNTTKRYGKCLRPTHNCERLDGPVEKNKNSHLDEDLILGDVIAAPVSVEKTAIYKFDGKKAIYDIFDLFSSKDLYHLFSLACGEKNREFLAATHSNDRVAHLYLLGELIDDMVGIKNLTKDYLSIRAVTEDDLTYKGTSSLAKNVSIRRNAVKTTLKPYYDDK